VSKAAKDNSDSFDKLRVAVRVCKATIETAFADAAADPTGRGPVLEQEIEELKTKIEEAQKYVGRSTCMTLSHRPTPISDQRLLAGSRRCRSPHCRRWCSLCLLSLRRDPGRGKPLLYCRLLSVPLGCRLFQGAAFLAAGAKIASNKKQEKLEGGNQCPNR